MNWIQLTDEQELENIIQSSNTQPIVIFKHSTRCSISTTAHSRLERNWKEEQTKHLKIYYLDLLSYRNISTKISETFNVKHESPQVLIIKNGECTYHASHMSISYEEILKKSSEVKV